MLKQHRAPREPQSKYTIGVPTVRGLLLTGCILARSPPQSLASFDHSELATTTNGKHPHKTRKHTQHGTNHEPDHRTHKQNTNTTKQTTPTKPNPTPPHPTHNTHTTQPNPHHKHHQTNHTKQTNKNGDKGERGKEEGGKERKRREERGERRRRRRRQETKTGTRGNRTRDLLHQRHSKTRASARGPLLPLEVAGTARSGSARRQPGAASCRPATTSIQSNNRRNAQRRKLVHRLGLPLSL